MSTASTSKAGGDVPNAATSSNVSVLRALHHLTEHIKHDPSCSREPPHLSHYRQPFPTDVQKAYEILQQGAQLVHSTSTKYTLVGKIHPEEQAKTLAKDLLRGCELMGAACHVIVQDPAGCSRAVRRTTQRACLAVLINVSQLVSVFEDQTAVGGGASNTIGAMKTGAVWEACDQVLNKLVPQGNRNAIRRDIFTWTRECQDSMEEFQEMIDLGPKLETVREDDEERLGTYNVRNGDEVENDDDDLFGHDAEEDQYTDLELPVAVACFGLLKNSRGNMKIALETCDALGDMVADRVDGDKEQYLDAIHQVYAHAQLVGEGLTELGSCLYPPLLESTEDLQSQVRTQTKNIREFQSYLLGLEFLPSSILEFANILLEASETRETEFLNALRTAGVNVLINDESAKIAQ